MLLFLSLLALVSGPALVHVARRHRRLLDVVDGFVVVTIVGIVALHLVPSALIELGAPALVPLVVGMVLPSWLERRRRKHGRVSSLDVLLIAGLAIHALIDGMALNTHEGHAHGEHGEHAVHGSTMLALAVSLHRIPEGVAIWWLVAPKHGFRIGSLALCVVGAASALGFLLSESLVERVPAAAFVGFEILVAGSLLHVVAHHELGGDHDEPHVHGSVAGHLHEGHAFASGLGGLVAAGLLVATTREHPIAHRVARELGFGTTLETLALACAPLLVLSLFLSYALHAFGERLPDTAVPSSPAARSRIRAATRGVLRGALLPICSCEVLGFYRSASRSIRSARSEALALLASAPEMEVASVLLSAVLIGPWFAVARPLAVSIIGIAVGAGLGSESSVPSPTKHSSAAAFAFGETVDHTGPWIVFGLFVAALAEPFLDPVVAAGAPSEVLVAAFALAGAFVPMCASGVTPLLAVLAHKHVDHGALLAFVIMAAAGNVRVLRSLGRLHSPAFAMRYAIVTIAGAIACGAVASAVLPQGDGESLHRAATAGGSPLGWLSLGLLLALFVLAMVRRGPRELLLRLVAGNHASGRSVRFCTAGGVDAIEVPREAHALRDLGGGERDEREAERMEVREEADVGGRHVRTKPKAVGG